MQRPTAIGSHILVFHLIVSMGCKMVFSKAFVEKVGLIFLRGTKDYISSGRLLLPVGKLSCLNNENYFYE